MSAAVPATDRQCLDSSHLEHAASLLSQQLWCWGRDILRPEGNWLLEIGFDRIEPPADLEDCSSVYVKQLSAGRCVVLRGFGVFFGDVRRGGVFLSRYEFQPRYTSESTLEKPPWSKADLPKLARPGASQRTDCAALTMDLIDWIRAYEFNVVNCLGLGYRRSTLEKWDNGERSVTAAEKFASAWRELSFRVAANFDAFCDPAAGESNLS